jgi:N-acetyl sugar amidotransferase
MEYCKKCVYPHSAVNLMVENDICSSCQSFEAFEKISVEQWEKKKNKLKDIFKSHQKKNKSNYDCLIPVSGGKDSYFQIHCIVKDLGLKPLLVTYDGNNFLPEGAYNRDMMKINFDADHITWSPSVDVLKKLNRIGFKKMGDMNWHNHCGIFSSPIIIAEKFNIPLIIWGEVNWDISGMFDPNDFVEFSARVRHEHNLRGFEWNDFLNDPVDKINAKDMIWAKYPSDEEIINKNIRGLYIGNFYKWDPNQHTKDMKDLYGWREAEKPFDRTYRRFSNLDDRYENGVHDLMKFVKFGYGRCSDHASKDIRTGYMNRQEAIELVKKYDHVISSDLQHWLNYVNMSEDEFWNIADSFRDHRVWWIENNKWMKRDIDGVVRSYGNIALNESQKNNFLKKKDM